MDDVLHFLPVSEANDSAEFGLDSAMDQYEFAEPRESEPVVPLPVATAAMREHTSVLKTFQRHLEEFKVRRAAERAAAAAGTTVGQMYDADDECAICAEKLCRPDAAIARCGHVLHSHCFEQLFEKGYSTCPICRSSVHRAGLIQIMNGLPTLNDYEVAQWDPEKQTGKPAAISPRKAAVDAAVGRAKTSGGDDVVDLTESPQHGKSGKRRQGAACSPSQYHTSAETAGRNLDAEIGRMLRNCSETVERAGCIRNVERSLKATHENLQKERADVVKDIEKEKQKLEGFISKRRLELRAEKIRLDSRAKSLSDNQHEMEEERVAVKKQMDTLLLKLKEVDVHMKEVVAREETAKRKIVDMEDKRDRFIRLKSQLEKEVSRTGKKSAPVLEKENKDLQGQNAALANQIDALRRQLRKAKNLPQLPSRETGNAPPGPSVMALFGAGLDLEGGLGSGEGGREGHADDGEHGSGDKETDESDEDVVAAADNIYKAGDSDAPSRRRAEPNIVEPADSRAMSTILFGQNLKVPQHRPQPRRGRAPRGVVGLSTFRPKVAPKPAAMGSIGAPRPGAPSRESTASGPIVLDKKRSTAPRAATHALTEQPPKKKPKEGNGRIDHFFRRT